MSVRVLAACRGGAAEEPDTARLTRAAERLLARVGRPEAELSVALVDVPAMAELNATWRGREGPTDVLSFSLLEGEGAEHRGALLGDVVLCVPVAASQARALGHGLDEELLRLLIHGTLHLLGFDHEREDEAAAMQSEERRLWDALHAVC